MGWISIIRLKERFTDSTDPINEREAILGHDWKIHWLKTRKLWMTVEQISIETKRFTELNTDPLYEIEATLSHNQKDSLIQILTCWIKEEWIVTEWFTDSKQNADPVKERRVNFLSLPKDSLIQLIHRMREKRILIMTERVTDSNPDSLNLHEQKGSVADIRISIAFPVRTLTAGITVLRYRSVNNWLQEGKCWKSKESIT